MFFPGMGLIFFPCPPHIFMLCLGTSITPRTATLHMVAETPKKRGLGEDDSEFPTHTEFHTASHYLLTWLISEVRPCLFADLQSYPGFLPDSSYDNTLVPSQGWFGSLSKEPEINSNETQSIDVCRGRENPWIYLAHVICKIKFIYWIQPDKGALKKFTFS